MSDETTIKPSKKARAKAAITPALRFSPFLDVVIRRASSKASSVIESRISRDAVHIHPTNPNVLLGKNVLLWHPDLSCATLADAGSPLDQ